MRIKRAAKFILLSMLCIIVSLSAFVYLRYIRFYINPRLKQKVASSIFDNVSQLKGFSIIGVIPRTNKLALTSKSTQTMFMVTVYDLGEAVPTSLLEKFNIKDVEGLSNLMIEEEQFNIKDCLAVLKGIGGEEAVSIIDKGKLEIRGKKIPFAKGEIKKNGDKSIMFVTIFNAISKENRLLTVIFNATGEGDKFCKNEVIYLLNLIKL